MIDDIERYRAMLKRSKAVLTDTHVVYASGKHGSAYINKDMIYANTADIATMGWGIAKHFHDTLKVDIDMVIGPAIGGIIMSQRVAEALCQIKMRPILSVFADKDGDGYVVKRGYDKLLKGKRVLVVEDVLNTGQSSRKTIDATRACECDIVGVGALCNRGGVTAEQLGVPHLYALIEISLDSWPAEHCPLCRANVPINTDVGKGRQFLARQKN